jgi:sulfite reductase (ferredoxin)
MSRVKNGYAMPHFQVVLGGQWTQNAGSYGLAIGAVPSKRIPEVVDRFTERYLADREPGETFQAYIKRIGKAACKAMVDDLMQVPSHELEPALYKDWGDAREYGVGDLGVGECAGEVISPCEFQLTAAEREAFEAQLQLEAGDVDRAAKTAYESMVHGALGLIKFRSFGFPEDAQAVVDRFRQEFYDTQLFFDPFVGGKFAHYLFGAHQRAGTRYNAESAHQLIEEAQVFIEACHSCYARLLEKPVAVAV